MVGVVVVLLLLLQVRLPQVDHALLARHPRKSILELLLMLSQEHSLLLELHLLDVVWGWGRGEDGTPATADAVESSPSVAVSSHLSTIGRPAK